MQPLFPTIIVVHPREKRSKCTVEWLRSREGFVFWRFPEDVPLLRRSSTTVPVDAAERPPQDDRVPEGLTGYVRLGLGGPLLSPADAGCGLLVLDGTWRLAKRMEPAFSGLPVRTLPAWETAYPRVSKLSPDPLGGLATIEAIFVAYTVLGWDAGLAPPSPPSSARGAERTSRPAAEAAAAPPEGLLDHYMWKDKFLRRNADRLPGGMAHACVPGENGGE
jgi:pre-rRNA-processing protein TSR3